MIRGPHELPDESVNGVDRPMMNPCATGTHNFRLNDSLALFLPHGIVLEVVFIQAQLLLYRPPYPFYREILQIIVLIDVPHSTAKSVFQKGS